MSNVVGKIIRELHKDKVIRLYTEKDRFIAPMLYSELKSKSKCMHCNKATKKGVKLEIHHKQPLSAGGSNERENLMALCHKCHVMLDKAGEKNWREWRTRT